MEGIFLDTNVFLRHFLNDDPDKSRAARELFRSIERGSVTAWTTSLVIAEIVLVLSNAKIYGVDRATIRDLLLPILSLPHLKLDHKRVYPRVFEHYVTYSVDYVDAYHAALVEHHGQDEVMSFDRDFDLIAGIHRREPI